MDITKAILQQVLDYVRVRFEYHSDAERYGCEEYWMTLADLDKNGKLRDDCDGHALFCRSELRKLEIPNRLVFCQCETGEYHLVCEVKGWILDNRYARVQNRDKLPYKWIAMSGYNKGDPWTEIKPA